MMILNVKNINFNIGSRIHLRGDTTQPYSCSWLENIPFTKASHWIQKFQSLPWNSAVLVLHWLPIRKDWYYFSVCPRTVQWIWAATKSLLRVFGVIKVEAKCTNWLQGSFQFSSATIFGLFFVMDGPPTRRRMEWFGNIYKGMKREHGLNWRK